MLSRLSTPTVPVWWKWDVIVCYCTLSCVQVTCCWLLEIGHGGNSYTTGINKYFQSGFFAPSACYTFAGAPLYLTQSHGNWEGSQPWVSRQLLPALDLFLSQTRGRRGQGKQGRSQRKLANTLDSSQGTARGLTLKAGLPGGIQG